MAMFARVMTLVLGIAGSELRTLLPLLIITLLCADIMAGQRFRKRERSIKKPTLMGKARERSQWEGFRE